MERLHLRGALRQEPDVADVVHDGAHDRADLHARRDRARPRGRPLAREGLVQPDDGAVLDDEVLEALEPLLEEAAGLLGLDLYAVEDASPEELPELGGEPVVLAAGAELLGHIGLVPALE